MKNIFIVTSARSEFGILQNIILELFQSKKVKSNLVVTGIHLEKKFGKTVDEISKLKIQKNNVGFSKQIDANRIGAIPKPHDGLWSA